MLTLRELKYLVRDALFEGVEQDRQELIKSFPDQENDISRLGPKWIMWLMARFGPSAKLEEVHPFADALATVKNYSQRDAAISQKYNSSEQWRQAVDQAFPNRKWKNPADVMTMTADDMETLLAMSQRKKQNVDVNQTSNVENDRIGKVGPWNLWMPTTRENSCQIAGYDPATMKPYTTWCTARTSGSNLFYNYVGRQETILFYLIKDEAKKSSERLSVGFVGGDPVLEGEGGGVSVDGANQGLTIKRLKSLLGGHYDQIMATLQDVADKNKGNHPAQKKIAEAGQSIVALKNLIRGLSKDEQDDLLQMIADQKTVSIEVAKYLCQVGNESIRRYIARNPSTHVEILTQLAQDEDGDVRSNVARNSNAPVEILTQLAHDQYKYVRRKVAQNPNTPVKVLQQMTQDEDEIVRKDVAYNTNTSVEILTQLAHDQNRHVRRQVAQNPNTHVKVLIQLTQDEDPTVRLYLTQNSNTPIEALMQLAQDEDRYVRLYLAQNPNTPVEVLTQLAQDEDTSVRQNVARHPNTPIGVLTQLAQDENVIVRHNTASNPNVPVEILTRFVQDEDRYARQIVASNKNTPGEILTQLAQDEDGDVRSNVAQNPNTPVEVLALLAKDKTAYIREYVAANQNTPINVLTRLAQNRSVNVRRSTARNPNTPVEVLTRLAQDKDTIVRMIAQEKLEKQRIKENRIYERVLKRLRSLI